MTTATAPTTTPLPPALEAALREMQSRIDVAAATGRTRSDAPASIVVINDAPTGLTDPTICEAVERLARLGRKVNMSVELRGHPLVPLIEHFSSAMLRDMALDPGTPHVYYRCLRPMRDVPCRTLDPGTTRVVHNDPNVLAAGFVDTGTFIRFHTDLAWAIVRFDGQKHEQALLVTDLLVEVTPE